MTTIVFLHIPKTAGQTVHAALARAVGPDAVSPVRVHTQADAEGQMPPGYRLYSGHIDWTHLDRLPRDRFVFSILRDPRERIASFYFYLRREAEALGEAELAQPENLGKLRALRWSADDYFFGGDDAWQRFIKDHYDNFYCAYFATRKIRGRSELADLPEAEVLARALTGVAQIDAIYTVSRLEAFERDLGALLHCPIEVTGSVHNAGPIRRGLRRWPRLLDQFADDRLRAAIEGFVGRDTEFMMRLGLGQELVTAG